MKKLAVRLVSTVLSLTVFMSHGIASFATDHQTDEVTFLSSSDEVIVTEEESDESSDQKSIETGEDTDLLILDGDETKSDSDEGETEDNTTEDDVQESDENVESDEEFEEIIITEESLDKISDDTAVKEADEAEEIDSELLDIEYEATATDKLLKEYAASKGSLEELKNLKEGVDYVSKEIITLAASKEDAQKVAEIYKGSLKSYSNNIAVISLSDSEYSVEEAYEYSLDDDYALPFVEPNYVTEFEEPAEQLFGIQSYEDHFDSYLPSDNAFSDRWWEDNYNDPYLNPDNAGYQWHHAAINTYSAWGVTTGNPDIVVGIIDSGIKAEHEEFAGHLKLVRDEAKGINTQEEAGANGEVHLSDPVGHGTHVAGIVGAGLNGSLGAGIAPNATILPLRVSDENGSVDESRVFSALMYVGDLSFDEENYLVSGGDIKADIINISIGFSSYSAMLELLIDGVHDAGVTTVVSMGNNNANLKQYPAYFDNVIAVCSTNEAGKLSNFSTYGNWADISAPGSNIYSCDEEGINGYVLMSGTSMASPVVAGACALYMSAYGHVDPDTMKRVLQSSVTGSAGSGTGAGILDLAKLLGGDTTAPLVSLKASDETLIGEVKDGKTYTVSYNVAGNSVISFAPLNYGGESGDNSNTRIVYTTDGSTPSVSNGSLINGINLERDDSGNLKTLRVSDIVGEITSPKKVTIKAIAVTGMGVTSKVSTLTFTVDANVEVKAEELDDGLAVQITNVPQGIVAGKSYKFESLVTVNDPETTVSQNVVWKIESYTGGDLSKCKINEKNGTLTTVAGKAGTLVISCTTENSRAVDTIAVNITGDYPVNAMKLTTASGGKAVNLKLQLDEAGTGMDGTSDIVVLSTFTDTKNHNLLTDSTFSYQNKTVEWISSNEKVAIVDPGSDSSVSPRATVTAMGAGSAVITCKALDGSGKSAKINVTVSSSIKAKGITIRKQSESDNVITALTTHTGEGDIALTSLTEYANGATNLNMPVWSSSNSKIVSITGEGFDARIKPLAKGTASIVCTTTDGSGKKATLKVTVLEYVSSINISGQKYVAKGGTGSFAATVLPATANNKKVKWEIVDNPDTANISINSANGRVTVKKTATCEEDTAVTIKATALDNGGVSSGLYTFKIKDKAKSVTAAIDSANGYKNVMATREAGNYSDHTIIIGSANNGTELTFTSSNPKVATVTYENNVATVKAVAKGSAKITASAQDGSGKKAVVNVSVVQLAETITVTGQANIARGNKAVFKAAVMPAAANNKKINWYLGDADGNPLTAVNGIAVNNGTVTVSAGATAGQTYTVMATAADGGEAVCTGARFTVTDVKTTSVAISLEDESVINKVNVPTYSKGVLTGLRLYDTNIPENDNLLENQIILSDSVYGTVNKAKTDITDAVSVIWSSSNNSIARLDNNADGTVTITGLKAGTANITCTAQDGSGKKATVKVTVIKPASGINIVPARGLTQFGDNNGVKSYLATGKATTAVPQIGTAYGKPTVSKVAWDKDYELGFYNMNSGEYCKIPDSYKAEYQKSKAFFTVANGKVTACNVQKMYQGLNKYLSKTVDEPNDYLWKPMVTLTARTTDGTDFSSKISYIMVEGSTQISFTTYSETANDYVGPAVKGGTCKIAVSPNYYGMSSYPVKIVSNGFMSNFNVSSSNTNVATAYASGSTLVIRPVGKGTTKITVTAMDGTNKKATITVKVTN